MTDTIDTTDECGNNHDCLTVSLNFPVTPSTFFTFQFNVYVQCLVIYFIYLSFSAKQINPELCRTATLIQNRTVRQ